MFLVCRACQRQKIWEQYSELEPMKTIKNQSNLLSTERQGVFSPENPALLSYDLLSQLELTERGLIFNKW